ncbi:HD domain-containing protein [Lactococcus raffinolactis]|uniref:HD domain-containing protein n=1 Tax=Pseudolactococcus raffinolactis TaxID=1366 RepID=UPI00143688D9|nr:HD domain-containing protein [Lactococcus raffinolactis]MBW9329851.1 HD domain-containing protein [Lactococcus raffinolactis]MDG4960771.1 HD domain-containing protein [Lactococcus raffinolactis]MDT2765189.1 HD domain-containing protein [Lactococcus raffinolactis]MDT2788659.1 HD domain-containing protein [Lactococcus raffinolactis]QIW51289.1 HD domain-containing protein [Lactococcus raffinolactis]
MSNTKLEKVFRDPVHNYISVSNQTIYDLIGTTEFQRLRRIKQLGTSSYTFHGAEHSRFTHCLGVYNIAKQITEMFTKNYPDIWNSEENLVTQCAALLHDVGHGAFSHTFEGVFDTDHEAITVNIITDPSTEVNAVLRKVAPDFPEKIASVITHDYENQQVVQLISSQIDADRMDYLLRDSYYTGATYGEFDLTRIMRVITPVDNGIAFKIQGMHAVEDYIVSRYQMYMQVYFHPASRAMEVLLHQLLKRAKVLYPTQKDYFELTSPRLVPFFEHNYTLSDYLHLDDGVMTTYFQNWQTHPDEILSNLSNAFINRKLAKSIKYDSADEKDLDILRQIIEKIGFDTDYYTAVHSNFDLPYDLYRPELQNPRTQIEIMQKDGTLTELSELSSLVKSLTGTTHGDNRFYFPRDILSPDTLFKTEQETFVSYIRNDHFLGKKRL